MNTRKQIYEFRDSLWNNMLENLQIKDNSLWDLTKRLTRKTHKTRSLEVNRTEISDDQNKAELSAKNYEKQFMPTDSKMPGYHWNINRKMGPYNIQKKKCYLNTRDAPSSKVMKFKI